MGCFLAELEERAATIDELLSAAFCSRRGSAKDARRAADRLAAWCRASADGDWNLFAQRLNRDGLTFQFVLSRLSRARRESASPIPAWVTDSTWIFDALKRKPGDDLFANHFGDAQPVAFEALLLSVVRAAEKELAGSLPEFEPSDPLRGVLAQLGSTLLAQLSQLCAPAIYGRFVAHRSATSAESPGNEAFNRFVSHMRKRGFEELFSAKPVLMRLIASLTRQWIESSREFIDRLVRDLPTICTELLNINPGSRAVSVYSGLSDLHNFGRSVLIVDFGEQRRVMYKPKDLRLDAFWHQLVGWLNCNGAPFDLRSPTVLLRDGYGWTEYIGTAECAHRADVASYYRRAGALLALFHAFSAADMHLENIIAAGPYPVPVDFETLLQAGEREAGDTIAERKALSLARKQIAESITATGFLPAYARTPENSVVGLGGLDGARKQASEPYWEFVNTDRMRPAQRPARITASANIPTFDGVESPLRDYLGPLIQGFSAYAQFLAENAERILSGEFFDTLRSASVRRLIKPTRFYSYLSERLKDHRNMDDGATWSAHLEFIARLSDWDEPKDPLWPLFRAERNALSTLNIPHFTALVEGFELTDFQGVRARDRDESSLERTRNRLRNLSGADADWQSRILRISTAALTRKEQCRVDRRLTSTGEYTEALANRRLLDCAADAVACITDVAIRCGPGASWVGLDWLGDSEVSQLVPLGFDLYNGAPGIALFLAAYAHATNDEAARELSLAGLAPVRSYLKGRSSARTARSIGVGGATGIGSVIYALTTIASLLEESALLADALAVTRLMTHELIAADRRFDALGGSAGAILSLLNLYRRTREIEVLNRAVDCGQHIILNHLPHPARREVRSASSVASHALTGMSHGAAGFAYAMAALHSATGREDFARAAEEWITFENSHFSSAHSNWPDLRRDTSASGSWICQWCYGAGGIGLSRIATLPHWHGDATVLRNDVTRAVGCAKQAWPNAVDTLCCGNLGNIEFLNEAGSFLEDQELRNLARRRLLTIVDEAQDVGDYQWDCGERRFNLGFFRGLAGVGYTLLRQLYPAIPNALIWE